MKKGLLLASSLCLLLAVPILTKAEDTVVESQEELVGEKVTEQTVESDVLVETADSVEPLEKVLVEPKNGQTELPIQLQGEWESDNDVLNSLTITANTYTLNGVQYEVKEYTLENNVYTVIWDEEAYIKTNGKPERWNPQPLMFTYNVEKDMIEIGEAHFHRKSLNNLDNKDNYEKFVENQDVPGFLQDKWLATVGDQKVIWTIGPRSFDINGVLQYKIIAYGITGNQYTLIWDVQDYIDRYGKPGIFNPQPIIFDYVESSDTLVAPDGIVFERESKKTTETETAESKKEEVKPTPLTDTTKKLPQTNETRSLVLVLMGTVSLLGVGILWIKK